MTTDRAPRARRTRLAPAFAAVGALLLAVPATSAAAHPRTGAPARAASPLAKVSPKPGATAKPAPGMGAAHACSPAVTYSVNGRTRPSRPLPAVTSRVGGDRLGASGLQLTASASTPPPAPQATAWLIADLGTGRVLAACNAHVPLAPASTLKLLTALTLTPKVDPAARYVARTEDANVDGTRVGLVPGSVYTARDLWHALLMGSANDAATGLAAMTGGTPSATAAMNETARSLGAGDTHAVNTSGLDAPGQVSSAYDLALFGRAALADPVITSYFQSRSYAFPEAGTAVGGASRKTFQIQNHDRLLYNYPGALGVKNGWTSTTGGSFVGAAERGGRRLVVTVLAADPQTWHMCASLLDWAFAATGPDAEGVGDLVTGPVAQAGAGDGSGGSGGSGGSDGGGADAGKAAGKQVAARQASAAMGSKADEGMSAGLFLGLVVGVVALITLGWNAGQAARRRRAGLGPAADDPWNRRRSR